MKAAPLPPDKEIRVLARTAIAQGWRVMPTRGGHWRWLAPTGEQIISSASASDHRAVANLLSRLRRAGFTEEDR